MQRIGLLGGMSWESTALYYRMLNEGVRQRLGGLHSAEIILHSVDFHDIEACQKAGDWDTAAAILTEAASGLKRAGADFLVLATNTMHKVAERIEAGSGLSLLHIADPTGQALRDAGVKTVGLMGTRFTMEQDFYRSRLEHRFGLNVLTPAPADRDDIHRIIYGELCMGIAAPASADRFTDIIQSLETAGAEAVILGCTEITLLVGPANSPLPVFDTTALHAAAALDRALA